MKTYKNSCTLKAAFIIGALCSQTLHQFEISNTVIHIHVSKSQTHKIFLTLVILRRRWAEASNVNAVHQPGRSCLAVA